MAKKSQTKIHECDGCGTTTPVNADGQLPSGWRELSIGMSSAGGAIFPEDRNVRPDEWNPAGTSEAQQITKVLTLCESCNSAPEAVALQWRRRHGIEK